MPSRKESLRIARRYRTCPPPGVLGGPLYSREVAYHKEICPYCAGGEPAGEGPWENLAGKLGMVLGGGGAAPAEAERAGPGEIRQVRAELGRWRDRLYYNPPMILVVETVSAVPDAVTVAQIYQDTLMAGPGDLILTEADVFLGPLFVEPWNCYTLSADSLGPVIDRVPGHVLDAVKALAEDETAYPEWAQRPVPMAGQDARLTFRRIEVETGYTFSVLDVERIMDEIEGTQLRLVYSSVAQARKEMVLKSPGLSWAKEPETIEETLTTARFPLDQLPLAASDETGPTIFAKLIRVKNERIDSVTPVSITVYEEGMEDPGVFSVDGRVEGMPEGMARAQLLAHYVPEKGSPVAPSDIRWDMETGSFLARFQAEFPLKGEFKAAVIYEI